VQPEACIPCPAEPDPKRDVHLMLSFTLDTNCVLAVDECRPEAPSIRLLAGAHANKTADVAVVAIMASEKQRPGQRVEDFGTFRSRLSHLGLGHLGLCLPLFYFDISFFDHCLWASPDAVALEQRIHRVLFPQIEFEYEDFCKARGLAVAPNVWDKPREPWRNAKCDVQAIWSHINGGRNTFVSDDDDFHKATKKPALLDLGAGKIERPEAAAGLLP
jgi:hypothetical protein